MDAKKTYSTENLTVAQFADVVGVCPNTVYNWIRDGLVRSTKIGHLRRIPATEFKRLGLARPSLAEDEGSK